MFKLTIWNRSYDLIGTIERPTAGELLDLGSRLQKDYGASYKLEWIEEEPVCIGCGKECLQCVN